MSPLPEFVRREVERAIADGLKPAGMGLNDGKTRIAVDRLQHLLAWIDRASQAPAAEPQWQPIDTAPKDGSQFLAFKPGTGHFVARILDMEHPDCEYDGGVHEAWSHKFVDDVKAWTPLPPRPAALAAAKEQQ